VDKSTVFFGDELPASTASDMVRRGQALRLVRGVFTNNVLTPPEETVKREWLKIVGHLFPDAVITDRSAQRIAPIDGELFLAHPHRDREIELPGLRVRARRGAGPLPDDTALPGGLHVASRARGLVENAEPTRGRGRSPRRLTHQELGLWVDQLCRQYGETALNTLRDQARALAPTVGVRDQSFSVLDSLIGAALGTSDAPNLPRALDARRRGEPYDSERVERFDRLVEALREAPPQSIDEPAEDGFLPFYEAYFSNFIEGTEFTPKEAEAIVFDGERPTDRPEDAHDIVGTYQIVSDRTEMSRMATTPEEFFDILRQRHAAIMEGRPEHHPGSFKTKANRAGTTVFVAPDLVMGTLREGFQRLVDLDTAWERAVLSMFLVSEVHPFADGNGRVARIAMNAELVAAHQSRMIIPTVFREDYLGALRRLSRQDDPSVLIKALRYAQEWTSRIDFTDLESAKEQMAATHAFDNDEGVHLLLPSKRLFDEPSPIEIDEHSEPSDSSDAQVRGYVRENGTKVRPHRRQPRRAG
jgi:fido (protein-threonine AMPylation protein)